MAGRRRQFEIDIVDPTADRDLVELCLSIPEEQFRLDGVPRSLVRRAMAGRVTPEILEKRERGEQGMDWPLAFSADHAAITAEIDGFRGSPLCRRMLDLDRMDRLMRVWPPTGWVCYDRTYLEYATLLRALAVGMFIRRHEQRMTTG